MQRSTELVCNWRGFAGASDPCGTRLVLACSPSVAVHRARFEFGWEFIHDSRDLDPREARDLDPDRPRHLILCPPHGARWVHWFSPRYRIPEKQAAHFVAEMMRRQTDLFSDDVGTPRIAGIHDSD